MAVSLSPSRIVLLTTAITATTQGTSRPVSCDGRESAAFYFKSTGTTSGGTLKIEEADYDPADGVYSGTWSQVGSDVSASSFTGGAQSAVHLTVGAFAFLRVRVSADITGGGSVSVVLRLQ